MSQSNINNEKKLKKTKKKQTKVKKTFYKKKKNGILATKQHVNGPPLKVEAFSSNWKKFLEQKNVQPIQTKPVSNIPETSKTKKKIQMSNSSVDNNHTNGGDNHRNGGDKHTNDGDKHTNTVKKQKDKTKSRNRKRKLTHDKEPEVDVEPNEIWFDVDPELLPTKKSKTNTAITTTTTTTTTNATSETSEDTNTKENISFSSNLTRYVALDCEMVGVGMEGKESILARVSIVNSLCECIYDKYVTPKEKVVDYRTHVSGVTPSHLNNAVEFSSVQQEVNDLLKDRILVGHALQNDLKVLMLSHSKLCIRDTSKYKPFRKLLKTKYPSLKRLAKEILHKEIQVGEHDSVIDAQITMQLYKKHKKEWERSLRAKGMKKTK